MAAHAREQQIFVPIVRLELRARSLEVAGGPTRSWPLLADRCRSRLRWGEEGRREGRGRRREKKEEKGKKKEKEKEKKKEKKFVPGCLGLMTLNLISLPLFHIETFR